MAGEASVVGYTYLRRYTDIPALTYLLREQKITLIDPQSWDDSNDSHFLALYREKKKLKSVLALCFTRAAETYHHWRVFANGPSGVCIRYKHSALLRAIRKHTALQIKTVKYRTLPQMRKRKPTIQELPFLKRFAFEHEDELRMIYESRTEAISKLDIAIPLSCIDRITLSPWIHPALSRHMKQVLRSIPDCSKLKIVRSTLIGNEQWKKIGESASPKANLLKAGKSSARRSTRKQLTKTPEL